MINDTAVTNSFGWKNNLAELPVGYRPITDMDYAVMYDGKDVPIRLIFRANGVVSAWCGNQSGGTISGCGAYIIN